MTNNTLSEKVSVIQDFLNEQRKQYALQQDTPLIPMIFSCIRTIEDTEEALEGYLKTDVDNLDVGVKYLFMYGVLQALIVQQEAVENLHAAFYIPYTKNPSLEKIRHIRIDAAGHPTNRGNRKAFSLITRKTLNAHGFELVTAYSENGKESEYRNVNIPNLIATQKSIFIDVLTNLIEKVKEVEVEHRKKFEDKKLTSAFQSTKHLFLKINDAIIYPNSPHIQLAETHVYEILKSVEEFRAGLKERGEPDYHIYNIYDDLENALLCLIAYFHTNSGIHIPRKYACVFTEIAQRHVEGLRTIAENYDRMYSQLN